MPHASKNVLSFTISCFFTTFIQEEGAENYPTGRAKCYREKECECAGDFSRQSTESEAIGVCRACVVNSLCLNERPYADGASAQCAGAFLLIGNAVGSDFLCYRHLRLIAH